MSGRDVIFRHRWMNNTCGQAFDMLKENPVRAKMVRKSENYPWSSAAAHCNGEADSVLTKRKYWRNQFESIGDWSAWLAEGDSEEELLVIRRKYRKKVLPCGSDKFIDKLGKRIGRILQYRPLGRPGKEKDDKKG